MTLGERIKLERKKKGITQKQLAEKINKGFSTVQKYEIDVITPPLDMIQKIADALGVKAVDILFDKDKATLYKQQNTEAINIAFYEFEKYTDKRIEEDMIKKYRKLNSTGKQKANDYITDLSEQEKYTTPDEE